MVLFRAFWKLYIFIRYKIVYDFYRGNGFRIFKIKKNWLRQIKNLFQIVYKSWLKIDFAIENWLTANENCIFDTWELVEIVRTSRSFWI